MKKASKNFCQHCKWEKQSVENLRKEVDKWKNLCNELGHMVWPLTWINSDTLNSLLSDIEKGSKQ